MENIVKSEVVETQSAVKKDTYLKYRLRVFKRKSLSEKITYCVFFVFFFVMAIVFLYPIFATLINSFRTSANYADPTRSAFDFPDVWYTDSWGSVFSDFIVNEVGYFGLLWNSIWMLVLRVVLATMSSACLAYAVARFRFPGKNLLYALVIFKQTIPIFGAGAAGFKLFTALNMINNPTVYWIAWCSGFDYEFIILYGAFKSISPTYSEAAKIDGANNLTVLVKIIFPQALPCIMALAINQAMGIWNDFNTSLIYMPRYPTMAYGLYIFQKDCWYLPNSTAIHSAALIISLLPVVILYTCSQKLLLTNMTVGGLKG